MRVNMKQQSTFPFEELISNEISCSLSSPLFLVRQCLSCLNGRAATATRPATSCDGEESRRFILFERDLEVVVCRSGTV